jgi:RNA polymerase sigma-70 factor (ECF subfamily)
MGRDSQRIEQIQRGCPLEDISRAASPKVGPKGMALEPSDLDLVTRHLQGEDKAFELLVRRYQRRVYGLALGILRSREDALDATQEAFIRVHKNIVRFERSASFHTWLHRIVVNLCIDQLRRAGRYKAVEYEDGLDHTGDGLLADPIVPTRLGTDPSRALEDKETLDAIRAGLDTLSPNHRAVLLLREVEGLSYSEMAKIMRCSKGTIMSRLFHARKRMQHFLRNALNVEKGSDV